MKLTKLLFVASSLLLVSCGPTSSEENNSTSVAPGEVSGFVYENPTAAYDGKVVQRDSSSVQEEEKKEMEAFNLADIKEDGQYIVEAEDCDTNGCQLQEGCGSFFEQTPASCNTSGGYCLACVVAPSVLAFKFTCESACTVEFSTICAKYEDNWSLDANCQYAVDDNPKFVTNYTAFGHTEENMWYCWKTVVLGSLALEKGTHIMNITVNGTFPNTDCFILNVTDYQA